MPPSTIIPAGTTQTTKTGPSATFTGDVFLELLHRDTNTATANVTFTPCARTHWHTHEGGQILKVTTGTGWICDRGGVPQKIKAGDVIVAPPGTTHWHGADEGSLMTHFVVGLGETKWLEAVSEEEYKKRE
ncbi:cupin domain-containing protein [Aspergillus karnatakaensis]|uniref:cupin domain-containing protein n=1 Tax=Aspergillus karnatakaensis TaxID=1810916 RepID=UPI003CCD4D37